MRVLAYRALGLGDLLTGVPALRGLRRAFPEAHLQLAAPAVLAPLVDLVGGVDELVDAAPLGTLPPRVAGPDLAVNLHGRGPQSTALLAGLAPGRLVAWGDDWRADEHEVHRWVRLLAREGVAADPADLDVAVDAPRTGVVVVHPGAAAASRRWPADRWRAVASALHARGEDVRVTGGADEVALAREVGADLPAGAVVAGTTGLRALAELVAGARLVLAPDTGVGHLATAVGTPSLLLFGPTPPALWGPPPDRPQHRVLWSGRTGDPLADAPDPGLLQITVEDVLAQLT